MLKMCREPFVVTYNIGEPFGPEPLCRGAFSDDITL